ncbi:hypothetical protein M2347_001411 [Chryseobacterium sp. H1D6B]|uniref:energy transducer TonB n=1 Tax=Chryseobacterium sp. H1D6B TaxID=2940588 RepID=UPI0015CC71C4|nr:hypothetical protein [Chryseobacterium sp. H1D6B]MDH6251684.1 hypothetical protein [Chryseobacterium sp. H1D6B]
MKTLSTLLFFIICSASLGAQQSVSENAPAKSQTYIYKEAEFPGGREALYKKLINNFDASKVSPEAVNVKADILFTVMQDGSIDKIKIMRCDNEAVKEAIINAMKKIDVKWSPAEENGIKKNSLFRLPFTWNPE